MKAPSSRVGVGLAATQPTACPTPPGHHVQRWRPACSCSSRPARGKRPRRPRHPSLRRQSSQAHPRWGSICCGPARLIARRRLVAGRRLPQQPPQQPPGRMRSPGLPLALDLLCAPRSKLWRPKCKQCAAPFAGRWAAWRGGNGGCTWGGSVSGPGAPRWQNRQLCSQAHSTLWLLLTDH